MEVNRRTLLRGALIAGASGVALALVGCEGEPVPVPSDDHADTVTEIVRIVDNAYVPEQVTVRPGQAVQWVWESVDQHDVVADDRSFVSELQYEGQYTHIFEETGEYPYECSIHPEMRGTVTVEEP